MNKKYIAVFSSIYPSDECIERIIDMTNNKSRKFFYKPIIVFAVIISLLLIGGIVANAATDGRVAEGAKTVFDKIICIPVNVTVDGKTVDENEYITETYDKNGKHILKVNTKNGDVICETPYEEYEKSNFGKSYTKTKYVDENGIIHEEIVCIGEEKTEPVK